MSYFTDTHFHLFLQGYDPGEGFDPDKIVKDSIENGVGEMWLASTNKVDIKKNLEFCKKYSDNLKTWVGFHPEHFDEYDEGFLRRILKRKSISNELGSKNDNPLTPRLGGKKKVPPQRGDLGGCIAGIGEVGVDLKCHDKSTLKKQQKVFEDQIKLALKYNLPVAVHSRDAYDETVDVLQGYADLKFIWHCYNLNVDKTEFLLNKFKNIYFGFNAIITYNSGKYVLESVSIVPNDKILTETDAPFLAPRPFKHEYNTPEGVVNVYRKLSEVKGMSLEIVKKCIFDNVRNLQFSNLNFQTDSNSEDNMNCGLL